MRPRMTSRGPFGLRAGCDRHWRLNRRPSGSGPGVEAGRDPRAGTRRLGTGAAYRLRDRCAAPPWFPGRSALRDRCLRMARPQVASRSVGALAMVASAAASSTSAIQVGSGPGRLSHPRACLWEGYGSPRPETGPGATAADENAAASRSCPPSNSDAIGPGAGERSALSATGRCGSAERCVTISSVTASRQGQRWPAAAKMVFGSGRFSRFRRACASCEQESSPSPRSTAPMPANKATLRWLFQRPCRTP